MMHMSLIYVVWVSWSFVLCSSTRDVTRRESNDATRSSNLSSKPNSLHLEPPSLLSSDIYHFFIFLSITTSKDMVYTTRKRAREVPDIVTADMTLAVNSTASLTSPQSRRVKRQGDHAARSKIATNRVKREGTLQKLPKMPLDIIDEVGGSWLQLKGGIE